MSSNAAQKYGNILFKLHEEFSGQFKYFKKIENKIQLLTYLSFFGVEKAADNLQLELTDVQSGKGLQEH
jgi:hypothetical protein